MAPLLSVCIPTYNRAAYLSVLLDSIYVQKRDDVEIVVSDNASTDNTREIVKKYPGIIYHRSGKNLGFDANVLKVVSLANGKYCWLVGDDDALANGAIDYILKNIKNNYAFYAITADLCDGALKPLQRGYKYIKYAKDGEIFDLSKTRGALAYLARVKANMGLFGYMGAAVFQKNIWDKITGADKVRGLGWVHVYMLWRFKAAFKYLARPVIKIRTQNYRDKGRVARLIVEFKGLYLTAAAALGSGQVFEGFLAAVSRYVAPNSIPPLFALSARDRKHWPQLVEWIKKYPYDDDFKKSLNSKRRISVIYFLREFLNMPACRHIKKPFKFMKDLLNG
ncbi:MAG: glycosyltransferase family 2 protein [Elusimicrobiota bacterium]|jgi:glycosyltransferase involved in cell wall biosynthesis|nr:glycosyltransferase family 2 protein [Elusimicrobiota bacterium]